MPTLDQYYAAKNRRDAARAGLRGFAASLRRLADRLEAPNGARPNEQTVLGGPAASYDIIDRSDLPEWSHLEAALRGFVEADSAFRRADAELTPEQRRNIAPSRSGDHPPTMS